MEEPEQKYEFLTEISIDIKDENDASFPYDEANEVVKQESCSDEGLSDYLSFIRYTS